MKRLITIIFILCLMPGCMHTYHMDNSMERGYRAVNTKSEFGRAVVLLDDGREIEVKKIHMQPDSSTWISLTTGRTESIATDRIIDVKIRNHEKGILEGMGVGFLTGVSLGVIVGAAMPDSDWFPAYANMGIMAGLLGASGGVLGLFIGGISGSKETYSFDSYAIPEIRRSQEPVK